GGADAPRSGQSRQRPALHDPRSSADNSPPRPEALARAPQVLLDAWRTGRGPGARTVRRGTGQHRNGTPPSLLGRGEVLGKSRTMSPPFQLLRTPKRSRPRRSAPGAFGSSRNIPGGSARVDA